MSDVEKADRLSRRRSRMLPFVTLIFLTQQASYFSQSGTERLVDHVKISAWIVLSLVLLLILATGGGWLQRREIRALLNDETTAEHRKQATGTGFWMAMGTAIGTYAVAMFEPVTGREAVHLVVTAGIAAALLHFSMLERRAHRDG